VQVKNDVIDVKLGGFGLCHFDYVRHSSGRVGTPPFLAPEVIVNEHKYDEKADIWALGIVFYILFTGTNLFLHKTTTELFNKIVNSHILFNRNLMNHQDFLDFIHKIFNRNPKQRPSARHLLNHPWIIKNVPLEY